MHVPPRRHGIFGNQSMAKGRLKGLWPSRTPIEIGGAQLFAQIGARGGAVREQHNIGAPFSNGVRRMRRHHFPCCPADAGGIDPAWLQPHIFGNFERLERAKSCRGKTVYIRWFQARFIQRISRGLSVQRIRRRLCRSRQSRQPDPGNSNAPTHRKFPLE